MSRGPVRLPAPGLMLIQYICGVNPVMRRLADRLGARPNATMRLHPGVNHAFALPSGPNYDAPTAIRANVESWRLLARHLPPRA